MATQVYYDDVEDNGDNEDDELIDEISDPYETNDDLDKAVDQDDEVEVGTS